MRTALLTVAAVFGLAACANTQEPLNANFGDAYYHNIAVQVIDPKPANAGSGPSDLEGERARVAIDRYRSSTTIVPEETATSDVGTSSSE
jgi:type IV pilus biogenesis protein CpaD/CtpE